MSAGTFRLLSRIAGSVGAKLVSTGIAEMG